MIKIIKIGSIKRKSLKTEMDYYFDKVKKYSKIDIKSLPESKFKDRQKVIDDESDRMLNCINSRNYTFCLDRTGNSINSIEFSKKINDILVMGKSPLFFIGGAYGTSEKFKKATDLRISLSSFTLQHDIALIVILEQIYRSFTILKNHPYHK